MMYSIALAVVTTTGINGLLALAMIPALVMALCFTIADRKFIEQYSK